MHAELPFLGPELVPVTIKVWSATLVMLLRADR